MPAAREQLESDGRWHLDKKVPIAMILAIIGQTFAFGWWAAAQSARIDMLEKEGARLEKRIDTQERVTTNASDRLIRVEEKITAILELTRQLADQARPRRNGGD